MNAQQVLFCSDIIFFFGSLLRFGMGKLWFSRGEVWFSELILDIRRDIPFDELSAAVVSTFVGAWLSMLVQSNAAGGAEAVERMQGTISCSGNRLHRVIAWQDCGPSLHAPRAETRLTVYRAHRSFEKTPAP